MTDSPKILLVSAGEDDGCAHYRMNEPARVAAEAGLAVEALPYLPMTAIVQGMDVQRVESFDYECDLVVLQRPAQRLLRQVIPWLQSRGVAVAVELDDDLTAIPRGNQAHDALDPRLHPEYNWQNVLDSCAIADLVICSTPALAAKFAPHGRSAVIRNRIPSYELSRPKVFPDRLRAGWTGTIANHPQDLQVAGSHIRAALQQAGAPAFNVVGDGDDVHAALNLPDDIEVVPTGWVPRPAYLPRMSEHIDVGVVPLALDEFNMSKSWLKLLEFSSQGIPAVVSPTPENARLAALTGTPLAVKQKDWQRHLKRLLTDRDLAIAMGQEAKEAVSNLTYENGLNEWAGAWMQAIENRARARSRPARAPRE